jgi:hypothetical protein
MNARLIRIFLLTSLAAVAACKGDAPEEEQGSAGFVLPGEEAYVSPEDSAMAAESIQARSDALRDSLRRAAGSEEEAGGAERPATGSSPAVRYASCMEQAAQAESPVRERLQAACDNIRAQPPADAPSP